MSHFKPMNPEYKAKWLKALRSRKYRQTQGVLKDPNGRMCCLGVLCDLVNPKEWRLNQGIPSFRGASCMPDPTVIRETGLSTKKCEKLADLNDGAGYNFKQIAEFIEEKF